MIYLVIGFDVIQGNECYVDDHYVQGLKGDQYVSTTFGMTDIFHVSSLDHRFQY